MGEEEAVEEDSGQVGLLQPEAGCHRARARNALLAPGNTPMSFINIHAGHTVTHTMLGRRRYSCLSIACHADGPEEELSALASWR